MEQFSKCAKSYTCGNFITLRRKSHLATVAKRNGLNLFCSACYLTVQLLTTNNNVEQNTHLTHHNLRVIE